MKALRRVDSGRLRFWFPVDMRVLAQSFSLHPFQYLQRSVVVSFVSSDDFLNQTVANDVTLRQVNDTNTFDLAQPRDRVL